MHLNSRKLQNHNSNTKVFWFIAGIELLQQLNHYACTESVNPIYYGNASSNLFRFRGDFEPRFFAGTKKSSNSADTTEGRSAVSGEDGAGGGGHDGGVNNGTRKPRGFQFHADRNDISIDIEFIVPFMKIPIERSMAVTASAFRNLVNLNTGSLLASGAFVAVGAAVAGIVKALSSPILIPNYSVAKNNKKARADGKISNLKNPFHLVTYGQAENGSAVPQKNVIRINNLVTSLSTKLHENDIDMAACIQKSICAYVKQVSAEVRMGKGSGLVKIIDGFANLEQLDSYLSGTAVQNSIDVGKSTDNCDYVYRSCRWSQPANKIMQFIANYFKYFNT